MHPDIPTFLDLAMQDSTYASQNKETPPNINKDLLQLSEKFGIPPVTTYQVLALLNTNELNDQGERLFSNSTEIKTQEHIFYETHRTIERHLKQAIDQILSNPQEIEDTTIEHFDQALSTSRSLFTNLTKEGFNSIRPYFQNNQDLPGPSGFYSAAFVVLDTIAIPDFSYDNTPRFNLLPTNTIDSAPYYTTREELINIIQLTKSDFKVAPIVQFYILEFLLNYRSTHLGQVLTFAPQLLENNENGTGADYNMTTKEFLHHKRNLTKQAYEKLKISLNQ